MAVPPGGPMDVVFSFDTTGSMSVVLDEVKGRINDIVQRLQADIPGFKVGVIAHGDYCDVEHFYDIKTLDLSDNVADVVTFVSNTEGTGGGDIPECYELALRRANDMTWRPGSRRVLVVIGDAYPHGPDYDMNKDHIDWEDELQGLVGKGIRIYGVQVQNDPESTSFFQKLVTESGGQHLKLANMSTICQVIMGICYREHDVEFFHNYEAELRANKKNGLNPDLESVFGALRKEESKIRDAVDDVNSDTSSNALVNTETGDSVAPKNSNEPSTSKANDGSASGVSLKRKRIEVVQEQLQKGAKKIKKETNKNAKSVRKGTTLTTKNKATKKQKVTGQPKQNTQKAEKRCRSSKRELVRGSKFKYRNLPWTKWNLAVSRLRSDMPGEWKQSIWLGKKSYWNKDLLKSCISKLQKLSKATTLFEIGVVPKNCAAVRVFGFRATSQCKVFPSGILGLPWYDNLFKRYRDDMSRAVYQHCKVFVRWAIVKKGSKYSKKRVPGGLKRRVPCDYDYPWFAKRRLVMLEKKNIVL